MRISDWSSDVCSSDLHQKRLRLVDRLSIGQCVPGLVQFVLQARECVEAADGEVEHRLDPFFSESIDDIGRYARIDRGLDVARNALIDEHGDRPRHCTRQGEILFQPVPAGIRSEEHKSELQSLMRNSYAVFCL